MKRLNKIMPFIMLSVLLTACDTEEDAARIVIGESNIIHEFNESQYQWPFVVQVTDLNGKPAPFTPVTITVKHTLYGVGSYFGTDDGWAVSSVVGAGNPYPRIFCRAEDLNNNGVLDAGEDVNTSGELEPTNSSTLTAHPELTPTITAGSNVLITDASGFGYFSLTYPKSEGNWSGYKVTARATVLGTEDTATSEGILPVSLADVSDTDITPPGGTTSAYGPIDPGCVPY